MAKKAMIEREKKREKLVAKYAAKRAELKEIATDESKPMEERFKARLKLAKQLAPPSAQPLPADRSSPCVLPQAENQPYRAAGSGLQGPASRHGQVELVREGI